MVIPKLRTGRDHSVPYRLLERLAQERREELVLLACSLDRPLAG
jgi:hypothetical protein